MTCSVHVSWHNVLDSYFLAPVQPSFISNKNFRNHNKNAQGTKVEIVMWTQLLPCFFTFPWTLPVLALWTCLQLVTPERRRALELCTCAQPFFLFCFVSSESSAWCTKAYWIRYAYHLISISQTFIFISKNLLYANTSFSWWYLPCSPIFALISPQHVRYIYVFNNSNFLKKLQNEKFPSVHRCCQHVLTEFTYKLSVSFDKWPKKFQKPLKQLLLHVGRIMLAMLVFLPE